MPYSESTEYWVSEVFPSIVKNGYRGGVKNWKNKKWKSRNETFKDFRVLLFNNASVKLESTETFLIITFNKKNPHGS